MISLLSLKVLGEDKLNFPLCCLYEYRYLGDSKGELSPSCLASA
ncbi:hypothetical protein PPEP_a1396 [Pseudoalteromonas peptidolytica F12-50-A1]|uniref:Uncharacterized protein n=1 Tax=Pseudoalteromonas peptidolytica F12-50-A1 TaxID=1315280 RepID=A0A8I0T5K4_9GAMM|nr:hypothetical protein [Pseudoalteromonas peptidolytica F12-50-A1]